MAYPFSWTPGSIFVTTPSQVNVFDSNGGLAVFDVGIAVSIGGTITFSLASPGRYKVVVREGLKVETGTFLTGTANVLHTPEFVTYEAFSHGDTNSSGNTVYDQSISASDLSKSVADQRAFAIAMAIAL